MLKTRLLQNLCHFKAREQFGRLVTAQSFSEATEAKIDIDKRPMYFVSSTTSRQGTVSLSSLCTSRRPLSATVGYIQLRVSIHTFDNYSETGVVRVPFVAEVGFGGKDEVIRVGFKCHCEPQLVRVILTCSLELQL